FISSVHLARRRSPTATLFPYTTLFRSGRGGGAGPTSAVLRLRLRVGGRLDLVVDGDLGLVAQLQQAAGGHLLAGLESLDHRDQVAAGRPGADEALGDDQLVAGERVALHVGLALLARHLADDEHRVAVGVEADRGLR